MMGDGVRHVVVCESILVGPFCLCIRFVTVVLPGNPFLGVVDTSEQLLVCWWGVWMLDQVTQVPHVEVAGELQCQYQAPVRGERAEFRWTLLWPDVL